MTVYFTDFCKRTALLFSVVCALVFWSGLSWGEEIPWHLGRVDGEQAAPSAINTAGNQPGPHPMVVAVIDSGVIASHPQLGRALAPRLRHGFGTQQLAQQPFQQFQP